MPRFLVGIDLGTTNSAAAFVDTHARNAGGPKLHTFPVAQVVAPGQVADRPLLPSFLYLPGPHDLAPGSVDLPWRENPGEVVGVFARNHGAKIPGRLVSSAKSWLCHPGVDRTAPLLPWAAPPDVPRLSPLDVSARYLRHVVEAWNATHHKPEERLEEQSVVITVPASFDDVARNLTADAAKQAGLKHVTLLEEPQAAFYAWLGTHSAEEAGMLKPGMRCAVIDVGGGTSDFSLIRAVVNKYSDSRPEHIACQWSSTTIAIKSQTGWARLQSQKPAIMCAPSPSCAGAKTPRCLPRFRARARAPTAFGSLSTTSMKTRGRRVNAPVRLAWTASMSLRSCSLAWHISRSQTRPGCARNW